MKELFVSDLDGTLLGADSIVSVESARIISELSARGAMITVATARTPATVQPLLTDCHITLPAIVFTGAAEWDLATQRFRSASYLTDDVAEQIEVIFRVAGITPFRYTIAGDGMIHSFFRSGNPSDVEQRFIDERKHLALKRMHVGERRLPDFTIGRTLMFFAIGPREQLFGIADRLRETTDCNVSSYLDIFGEDTGIVEVFARGVSKAAAVERLAQRVGAERVTVFGDNLNDLPMMGVADTAVAVENAAADVKAAADIVIGPNTADSVARYIAGKIG